MSVPSNCLKPSVHAWAAIFAAIIVCSRADAACDPVFEGPPNSPIIDYDVFRFERAVASTAFFLRNEGDEVCTLRLAITDLTQAPPPFQIPGRAVAIDVIAPELQRPQSDEVIGGVFEVVLAPSEDRRVDLDFFTDQNRALRAGRYDTDLELTVEELAGSMPPTRFLFTATLDVRPRAQVNIAGTDGVFSPQSSADRVDFGEPEIGESRRVFLQTRANTNAVVTVRSVNGGRLVHESETGSAILYEVLLGSQTLDLAAPAVVDGYGATNYGGVSTPMDITLTGMERPLAGGYQDTIIVEIAAQ